jgi:hypothetical protein
MEETTRRYIPWDRTLLRKLKYEVPPTLIMYDDAKETYGGIEVYLHAYLTSALHEGEWLPSRARYRPYLYRELNSDSSIMQPIT